MYARALDLYIITGLNQFFSAGQTRPMESDLSVLKIIVTSNNFVPGSELLLSGPKMMQDFEFL